MGEPETLSLEESAALAKVGLECWRSLVDSGEVPAVKLNGKHTVLLREDVIDFLRTKARQQAEERRKARARPERRRRGARPDLAQYGG